MTRTRTLALLFLLIATSARAQVVITPTQGSGTAGTITGGACGAGTFVNAVSTLGVPTCAAQGSTTTALDNLASVNINTSMLAQTGVDLGSTTKPFRDLFLFGGGTYGTNYLRLTGTPTGTRVLTVPDITDTLVGRTTTDTLTNKTFTAPVLGAATATTINKLTFTQPATGATLTIPDGVTLTGPSSSATVATLGLTNAFTGRLDASGAASTAPFKVGTSLPGTCVVGDQYFKSDATAGQAIYECDSTNHWTQQLAGGGGGTGDASTNTSTSVDSECVLFSLTTGKLLKRCTGTGWTKLTSGVQTTITPGANVETFVTTPTVTNLAATVGSQSANNFLAAPDGSAGNFVARALVSGDFPKDITETAVSGTITISTYGGSYRVTAASALTINLPTVTSQVGKTLAICVDRSSAGLVTLDANGSQTIDGSLTRIMQAGECAEMVINATEWTKISGRSIPMSVTASRQVTDSAAIVAGGVVVPFDTKVAASNAAMWDVGNLRPVIARPSLYRVEMSFATKGMTSSDEMTLAALVNGTTSIGGCTTYNSPTGALGFCMGGIPDYTFALNDYLQAYAVIFTGGGGTEKVNGSTAIPLLMTVRELDPW